MGGYGTEGLAGNDHPPWPYHYGMARRSAARENNGGQTTGAVCRTQSWAAALSDLAQFNLTMQSTSNTEWTTTDHTVEALSKE